MSTKKIISQLSELTDAYISEYNSQKYKAYIEEIRDLLVFILLENDSLFGHVVSRFLLIKLYNHEANLASLTRWPRNPKFIEYQNKLKLTNTFIDDIITEYEKPLSGTEALVMYRNSVQNEIESVLTPGSIHVPIEWTPTSLYNKLLDEKKNEVILYFKNKLRINPYSYQEELFHFMSILDRQIDQADKSIYELQEKKTILAQKLKCDETEVNLEDFLATENELKNTINHKKGITDLHSTLIDSHLVLSSYAKDESIPINVFGSTNYDIMIKFYQELKFFLPNTVTQAQVFETFRVNNIAPNKKIQLINGTLNDYAHLINELEQYFISPINEKSTYNQWWADRFMFNTVRGSKSKSADAISTMRSNTRKSVTRKPSKPNQIKDIVSTIASIPQ
jgi:hypothetical protein